MLASGMAFARKKSSIDRAIIGEICKALEQLGAHPYLVGVVCAWGDKLSGPEVLALLKELNKDRRTERPRPRGRPRLTVVGGREAG